MPDFPIPRWPTLGTITTYSFEAGLTLLGQKFLPASVTTFATGVTNRAYYFPFMVYEPVTALQMSYIVGGTSNGTVDLGIYDAQKNRLVAAGATTQGTINLIQTLNITDTDLLPGLYYMAILFSSATGTALVSTAVADEVGQSAQQYLMEAVGASGLPATAAWTQSTDANAPQIPLAIHFHSLV